MIILHDSYFGDEPAEKDYPGMPSFKDNRAFCCWWRLVDDSSWGNLYDKTGVLNGKKKKQYRRTMNSILTNIYKSDGKPIIYLRHQDNYRQGTFYHNEELSWRITISCIDALCDADLIKQGKGDIYHDERFSYFQCTELLKEIFEGLDITHSNITYELTRTVYLRDHKNEYGRRGKFLPVDYTSKGMITLNNLLRRYNEFIKGFDITWDAPGEARLLNKCLNWRYQPDLDYRALYSIFNGNMSNGGRMYGAFWINLAKVLRPYLRIEGEPLTDIDFNACHIQFLYSVIKADAPQNPYLYERGDERRDIAKKLLLTTLNYKAEDGKSEAQTRRGVIGASLKDEYYDFGYPEVQAILIELENLHTPIRKFFYTGKGLSLQKVEADLMRKIMKSCIKENIPILPCHDGCSVRVSDANRVEEIFREETDLPFSRENLLGDTTKVRNKVRKWIEGNPKDSRLNEIKEKFQELSLGW